MMTFEILTIKHHLTFLFGYLFSPGDQGDPATALTKRFNPIGS